MAKKQKYERINAHETTHYVGTGLVFDQTQTNGSADCGKAVKLGATAGTVELVGAGDEIHGRLEKIEPDGQVTVNDQGYMELPTDGTVITFGGGLVGGAVAGTVKTGASPTVKAVDTNGVGTVTAFLR